MNEVQRLYSFCETLASVARTDALFSEIAVEADGLTLKEDGLDIGGQLYGLPQETRDRLFRIVSAPAHYLRQSRPAIQTTLLTDHLQRGDFGRTITVAVRRDEVFTIFRRDLIQLSNCEVLRAVADGLGDNLESLSVAKVGDTGERLEVELLSLRKSIEVRQGDIVQGGLQVVHHRFGQQATVIQSYLLRQVCTNGMTIRECITRDGIVRTRKLPVGHPNGREVQLAQITRLAAKTWDALEPQLDQLKTTSQHSVDVQAVIARWLERARMSLRLLPRLIDAWRTEGAESTEFGVINALTRVATHDQTLSVRQRRMLASLGGLLANSRRHICPRCFSVLAAGDSAQDNGVDSLH